MALSFLQLLRRRPPETDTARDRPPLSPEPVHYGKLEWSSLPGTGPARLVLDWSDPPA